MPLVRLQSTGSLGDPERATLMKALSSTTARVLAKPESYVMVVLELGASMLMAGSPEPAAFLDVRAAGEIESETARNLSRELSAVVADALAVELDRIFANFTGVSRTHWGHRGATLAAP